MVCGARIECNTGSSSNSSGRAQHCHHRKNVQSRIQKIKCVFYGFSGL